MPDDIPRDPPHDSSALAGGRFWLRRVASAGVMLFVLWHLLFLVLTNAKIESPLIDATIGRYESYAGLDQGWAMFTSPLWSRLPFPAARIEFEQGLAVLVLSENEPRDMRRFFRWGGARHRKIEHYLVTRDLQGTYQAPMQRRLALSYVQRWRIQNPEDGRRPVAVTLLSRNYEAPPPGEAWADEPAVEERIVVRLELTSLEVEALELETPDLETPQPEAPQ